MQIHWTRPGGVERQVRPGGQVTFRSYLDNFRIIFMLYLYHIEMILKWFNHRRGRCDQGGRSPVQCAVRVIEYLQNYLNPFESIEICFRISLKGGLERTYWNPLKTILIPAESFRISSGDFKGWRRRHIWVIWLILKIHEFIGINYSQNGSQDTAGYFYKCNALNQVFF